METAHNKRPRLKLNGQNPSTSTKLIWAPCDQDHGQLENLISPATQLASSAPWEWGRRAGRVGRPGWSRPIRPRTQPSPAGGEDHDEGGDDYHCGDSDDAHGVESLFGNQVALPTWHPDTCQLGDLTTFWLKMISTWHLWVSSNLWQTYRSNVSRVSHLVISRMIYLNAFFHSLILKFQLTGDSNLRTATSNLKNERVVQYLCLTPDKKLIALNLSAAGLNWKLGWTTMAATWKGWSWGKYRILNNIWLPLYLYVHREGPKSNCCALILEYTHSNVAGNVQRLIWFCIEGHYEVIQSIENLTL